MSIIIWITLSLLYLFTGGIIGGILDDSRNKAVTDGILHDKKIGVWACVLFWPLVILAFLLITFLNIAYLLGKRIKNKLGCVNGNSKLDKRGA